MSAAQEQTSRVLVRSACAVAAQYGFRCSWLLLMHSEANMEYVLAFDLYSQVASYSRVLTIYVGWKLIKRMYASQDDPYPASLSSKVDLSLCSIQLLTL